VVVACAVAITACADDGPVALDGPVPHEATGDVGVDLHQAAVAVRVSACRPVIVRGAGLLIAPDLVLTAAHVVAGATAIDVIGHAGIEVSAEVVAFDPENDLAVLKVPTTTLGTAVPLASDPPTEAFAGEVVVFRQGVAVIEPAQILRRVTINTDDIYRGTPTSRPGYELQAAILPGDSGGVIVHAGEAVAVVWSRSRLTDARAWAIDPIRGGHAIRSQLANGRVADGVDLSRCA